MNIIRKVELNALINAINTDSAMPDLGCKYTDLCEAITLMRMRYETQITSLEKALAERDASVLDIQRIRGEHHLAEQIQRSMLPDNLGSMIGTEKVDLYADMDAAWEIGGDYYDYFMINDHELFFCIADVSGKSVSAAMFSMVVKTVISMSIMNGDPLNEICTNISKQLYLSQHGGKHMFVTAWMGILDLNSGKLAFVNAGHEAPVIAYASGAVSFCDSLSGIPLAAYYNPKRPEKSAYKLHEITLKHGDSLLLYTDGVNESANKNGQRLGQNRLIELTQIIDVSKHTMRDWVTYIQRNVITHANHAERDDDITLLALRWN